MGGRPVTAPLRAVPPAGGGDGIGATTEADADAWDAALHLLRAAAESTPAVLTALTKWFRADWLERPCDRAILATCVVLAADGHPPGLPALMDRLVADGACTREVKARVLALASTTPYCEQLDRYARITARQAFRRTLAEGLQAQLDELEHSNDAERWHRYTELGRRLRAIADAAHIREDAAE
jgi:hypothetical protein